MDNEKREIRFLIDKSIYDELVEEAENLDIPLASYMKANIKNWREKCQKKKKRLVDSQVD